MGPWKFCTGLPDRHGFESHVRHTVVSASQCFALTGIGKYGLGAANFLPECTHDMVWYTMVKTTKKKKSKRCLCLCKKLSPAEVSKHLRAIRENAVHTALRKNRNVVFVFARNCPQSRKYQYGPPGTYEKMPCTPPCEKRNTLSFASFFAHAVRGCAALAAETAACRRYSVARGPLTKTADGTKASSQSIMSRYR